MATIVFAKDGYGQVELNNAAFRRDGRIEAQAKLDATDFANAPAQNGMLLEVNGAARTVQLPDDMIHPLALVYSAERVYDERKPGLKNHVHTIDGFLPRLGYLSVGDKWTSNLFQYDSGLAADDGALLLKLTPAALASAPLYGIPSKSGIIELIGSLTTGSDPATPIETPILLEVVKLTTMPDGQKAVQFKVLRV